MGRKKKVSAARSITTRSTRQSVKANAVIATETSTAADSNSLDSENGSASQDASGENDSQDSNHTTIGPSGVPVTSLCHKKFGKYRCLMLGDSKYQLLGNSEVSGSDSETGSGVEVRIIDPCVSSESDCSTPLESTICASTSDSVPLKTFSKLEHDSSNTDSQKAYREKVFHSNLMETINCSSDSNTLDSDTPINLNSITFDTQLPDPTLNLIINSDPRRGFKIVCEDPITIEETLSPAVSDNAPSTGMECFSDGVEVAEVTVGEEQDFLEEDHHGDNDVITVLEILDENGSDNQDLYYEMNVDDVIFSESKKSPESVEPTVAAPSSDSNSSSKNIQQVLDTPHSVDSSVINDFQNKLSNLKLTSNDSSPQPEPEAVEALDPEIMDCTDVQKNEISLPDSDNCTQSEHKENIPCPASSPVLTPQSETSKTIGTGEICVATSNHLEEEALSLNKLESDNMNCESNEANLGCSTDSSSCSSASGVRRSSRIKTISVLKQRSKGHGLVRAPQKKTEIPLVKEVLVKVSENLCEAISKSSPDSFPSSPSSSVTMPLSSPSFPVPVLDSELKPVKVKSRWRRSSEMEMGSRSPVTPPLHSPNASAKLPIITESSDSFPGTLKTDFNCSQQPMLQSDQCVDDEDTQKRLKQFEIILENEYHCDRTISKEARRMTCDCFLTKEEIERGELGCGEDCLNRLLMIECNSRCPVGDRCTNRRFQTRQYSNLRVMRTEKKGLGIQAITNISGGDFLMEYVGEVLNSKHFNQRAEEYSSDKNTHHYFMALKGDAVIDATLKGNISRFINHSCDPNSETQKWTVNGELRIGFFSKRDVNAGDEITFDYQFQRYGKEAQKCFCEASNCRGWIGEEPDTDSEEEDGESEDDEKTVEIKSEMEEGKIEKSDIKEETKPDELKDEVVKQVITVEAAVKKRGRPKKYARAAKELLQDVDLEEEMEMLGRSGVKNQSQTLSLCRAMVRAKRTAARAALLTLLASADLPCRRLFLDYRGLRLLAPWCEDANANFRLDMLTALEKLPIPNKTILQECKLIAYIEKWLSDTHPKSPKDDWSDNSRQGTPVLIDENTGLPAEVPHKFNHKVETDVLPLNESGDSIETKLETEVVIHTEVQKEEIARLSQLLLDRWSQLKEIFKIPKRERIELMKEHERQANEPHTRRDRERDKEGGVRKTRWEERYSRNDRDKKRSRPPSPDTPRRSQIRSDERVSNSISKEERRREFAERAAREEQQRSRPPAPPVTPDLPKSSGGRRVLLPSPTTHKHWVPPEFMQNMPQGPPPFGPMMMNGMPPPEFMLPPNMANFMPPEYMAMEYMPPEYMQQKPFMLPYCGPQQMFSMSMMDPMAPPVQNFPNPGFMQMMAQNPNFAPPPSLPPASSYQNIPLPPNIPSLQQIPQPPVPIKQPLLPLPIPEIPNQAILMNPPPSMPPRPKTPLPQHIPTLVPAMPVGYPYPTEEPLQINPPFYPPIPETVSTVYRCQEVDPVMAESIPTPTDENQDAGDALVDVPLWTPVRLPSQWRSMHDARGRIYYYHVKLRLPQWEPPLYSPTPNSKDEDSSGDEDDSSEEEPENGEDAVAVVADEFHSIRSKLVEGVDGVYQVIKEDLIGKNGVEIQTSPKKMKKKRPGLVTNCWIISPRREEDRIANQLELKRYKENKEKLRRRKEQALLAAAAQSDAIILKYKKRLKEKHKKSKDPAQSSSRKKKEADLVAEESERRIKEIFRSRMARVMVHHLNPFRKEDCPLGHITNTADFKHLARKLTHFVMLKELKHCKDVNELDCNDSVKQKAKEFVKKYMAKFGPVYRRPPDEMD